MKPGMWQRGTPDRRGEYRYAVMIRSPNDPERSARGSDRRRAALHWMAVLRMPHAELKAAIEELLMDGKPRTFNAIGVELWDKTADILYAEAPETCLWALVSSGKVLWRDADAWVEFTAAAAHAESLF